MRHDYLLRAALVAMLTFCGLSSTASADRDRLLNELNEHDSVKGVESSKGWRILFDAYLKMPKPPQPVGPEFNLETIWPGMENWDEVSAWASASPELADAIIETSHRTIIGLPYGVDNVPATYLQKGVVIEIWAGGNISKNEFRYLDALKEILAYSTAETYRRLEAGEVQEAMDLATAQLWMLRKFCDRDFLLEKMTSMELLITSLQNMRDYFYAYSDKIDASRLRHVVRKELPFLRTDRSRLFIPEGDRIVAEEIFKEVFDRDTGFAKSSKFRDVFTEIQAGREPLARFGAGRRWIEIAENYHGGYGATQEKLKNIFDDWWRRWRIQEYSQMLGMETEYDKTNATRYAAVLFVVNDIMEVFELRKLLLSEVRATIVSGSLCTYRIEHQGKYPAKIVALYPDPLFKQQSIDVFNEDLLAFQYRKLTKRTAFDIGIDRIWVEPGQCLLYSFGPNLEDDRKIEGNPVHGEETDIIYWPPTKSLIRDQEGRP